VATASKKRADKAPAKRTTAKPVAGKAPASKSVASKPVASKAVAGKPVPTSKAAPAKARPGKVAIAKESRVAAPPKKAERKAGPPAEPKTAKRKAPGRAAGPSVRGGRAVAETGAGSGARAAAPRKAKRPAYLTPKVLAKLRERLVSKRQELLAAYTSSKGDTRNRQDDGTEDYIDYAVSSYDREFLLSLTEMERKELMLVEEALKRMERGEFGFCMASGEPIPLQRLEVQPWARYSVRYQELEDQGLLNGSRGSGGSDDEWDEEGGGSEPDFDSDDDYAGDDADESLGDDDDSDRDDDDDDV
jgi:DnaK suppressor protein